MLNNVKTKKPLTITKKLSMNSSKQLYKKRCAEQFRPPFKTKIYWIIIFLLGLSCNQNKEDRDAYVAFYNYSTHGDASVCYVEIILPIEEKNTHSSFNDSDYFNQSLFVKGAEIIIKSDTVPLFYLPRYMKGYFRSLSKMKELNDTAYSSYILRLKSPYNIGGSLFQADSIFKDLSVEAKCIRYLTSSGVYKSIEFARLNFKKYYFLDGKEVFSNSEDFFRNMRVELPPIIGD